MITYTQGNLLDAKAEALVNTVNTVGVMGKGIALMFKESFPENFKAYTKACEMGQIEVGRMFVTERQNLIGPRWVINFPTKQHWRNPTKLEWITSGLDDLKKVIAEKQIHSIALPPLGCGNGGLDWTIVRPLIEKALSDLSNLQIIVYEPTGQYQNVAKREGVEKLTPARALVAELIRRYWILGIECTLLEIQKLAWFLERSIERERLENQLNLKFLPHKFGPYSNNLTHLLNSLDGSYLHCEKRIGDAGPLDVIWFEDSKRDRVQVFLTTEDAKIYRKALDTTSNLIDGFQSPLGMELLASVDWLLHKENVEPSVEAVKKGLGLWPAGKEAAARKTRIFDDRLINLAVQRLESFQTDKSHSPDHP